MVFDSVFNSVFGAIGIAALVVLVFVFVWFLFAYNKLVRLRALSKELWDGIEAKLKRRYALIPQVISVVNMHSVHERDVVDEVASLRSFSMETVQVDKKAEAEAGLTLAINTLFEVTENYPDLKSNNNFISLQKELKQIEKELAEYRKNYNTVVRKYNNAIDMFPSNIVAKFFNFLKKPYFRLVGD